jgi:hypothetical protein
LLSKFQTCKVFLLKTTGACLAFLIVHVYELVFFLYSVLGKLLRSICKFCYIKQGLFLFERPCIKAGTFNYKIELKGILCAMHHRHEYRTLEEKI